MGSTSMFPTDAKLMRRATAVSLHARGISIAHVPWAMEKLVSIGQRWAYALLISSVVNSRAVVPISKGRLYAGSSTRTTSMWVYGVSRKCRCRHRRTRTSPPILTVHGRGLSVCAFVVGSLLSSPNS